MFTQAKALPRILSFSEARYYIFTSVFVTSAVFFPWLAHQFHIAGPIFLPMHFFVLIAGFLFGWRAGMMVGLFSTLMSYGITHLPPIAILPEVVFELTAYGFAIGVLREKRLNIWTALFGAMILGRAARWAFVLVLGLQTNPWHFFQISWPGILLQLSLIPVIVLLLQKFVFFKNEEKVQ